jgi:hypothetical protein
MTIMLIGGLAGAVLGLRFRAMILLLAILIATAVVTGGGIATGESARALAITVLAIVAALQVGYICGAILRGTLVAPRVRSEGIVLPTHR